MIYLARSVLVMIALACITAGCMVGLVMGWGYGVPR